MQCMLIDRSIDASTILFPTILDLSLVFNQMCDDAEFALETPVFKVKVQGFFICHMINYTGYNQKWNVGQIRCIQIRCILLASNSSHTYITRTFRKIIFHKVLKGWNKLQGHSRASLRRMRCERHTLCLMIHVKCAVSLVCIFLANGLRSHHLCGLECSGLYGCI